MRMILDPSKTNTLDRCKQTGQYIAHENNNNNTLYFHWVTGFTQSNFRPGPTF